jgi:hypothetical protein
MDDRSSPAFRVERRVLGGLGLFLIPWLTIYALTEHDDAGALLLGLSAVALLAIAVFLLFVSRGLTSRPSDRSNEPPPERLVHHPHVMSIWPLVMAAAATLLGFGAAFTLWVAVPAGLLFAIAVVGYARETG